MIELGLSRDDYRAYLNALRDNHRVKIEVGLLNQNEDHIDSLTAPLNRVLDGSVQIDTTGEVSRSLDLTVLDPRRQLRFESGSPARGAIFGDRFVTVEYCVYVNESIGWVNVPVFWGPVTGLSRHGSEVQIEAQGKESLMLEPHFTTRGFTLPRKTRLDDAIRRVARRTGEDRFSLPDFGTRKLHRARPVTSESQPWQVLAGGGTDADGKDVPGLVEATGEHMIFYDGRGRLTVRRRKRAGIMVLKEGRDFIEEPEITYDVSEFRNTVVVKGAKPKGKPPARARATLPSGHPLSPRGLARNGEPRYMTEFIEADNLKTDAECQNRANDLLKTRSEMGVELAAEILPFPHLEEGDRLRIHTDHWAMTVPAEQFTIPLTAGDSMSIGENKRVKVRRRRAKKRHKGK